MKVFTSPSQKIGLLGEEYVQKHLEEAGFTLLERNQGYRIGEIDIIAKKNSVLYFIEVKTVSIKSSFLGISAEDQMTYSKIRKMRRAVSLYLAINKVSQETEIEMTLYSVKYNQKENTCTHTTYKITD